MQWESFVMVTEAKYWKITIYFGFCDQKYLSLSLKFFFTSAHKAELKFRTQYWGLCTPLGATVYLIWLFCTESANLNWIAFPSLFFIEMNHAIKNKFTLSKMNTIIIIIKKKYAISSPKWYFDLLSTDKNLYLAIYDFTYNENINCLKLFSQKINLSVKNLFVNQIFSINIKCI